jgi:hypothetical protein
MKITEDTTLKEIIPEGYEFERTIDMTSTEPPTEKPCVIVKIKKKEEKDFGWYINSYMLKKHCVIVPKTHPDPIDWSWEERVCLLKFICDDNNVNWAHIINNFTMQVTGIGFGGGAGYEYVKSILPKEFINSII